MFSHVSKHFSQQWQNAEFINEPYPHIFIENVFPEDFYQQLTDHAPDNDNLYTLNSLGRVGKGYPTTRKIFSLDAKGMQVLEGEMKSFWTSMSKWIASEEFTGPILRKFNPLIKKRFEGKKYKLTAEALYVQDEPTYALGPHTDSESKVITLLFYLPRDESMRNLGTSMYVPRDAAFVCEGGPHHSFDKFTLFKTAPFIPNAMFGFFKTNNSFHGVEPIDQKVLRNLMLYDVKYKTLQ
jgi:hypothetical protein